MSLSCWKLAFGHAGPGSFLESAMPLMWLELLISQVLPCKYRRAIESPPGLVQRLRGVSLGKQLQQQQQQQQQQCKQRRANEHSPHILARDRIAAASCTLAERAFGTQQRLHRVGLGATQRRHPALAVGLGPALQQQPHSLDVAA